MFTPRIDAWRWRGAVVCALLTGCVGGPISDLPVKGTQGDQGGGSTAGAAEDGAGAAADAGRACTGSDAGMPLDARTPDARAGDDVDGSAGDAGVEAFDAGGRSSDE